MEKIEQALKHAKQAISLYGYDVDLSYKTDTSGNYVIKGTVYTPAQPAPAPKADGYKDV